jgi:hypothetical protein
VKGDIHHRLLSAMATRVRNRPFSARLGKDEIALGRRRNPGYNQTAWSANIPQVGVHTGILGGPMFDSLTDRIRQDEGPPAKTSERLIRLAVVVLVAIVLFGGLYMVVQHLE